MLRLRKTSIQKNKKNTDQKIKTSMQKNKKNTDQKTNKRKVLCMWWKKKTSHSLPIVPANLWLGEYKLRIKNQIAAHQKRITIKKLGKGEGMAFDPWPSRPDYSAIPTILQLRDPRIWYCALYINIYASIWINKKKWG